MEQESNVYKLCAGEPAGKLLLWMRDDWRITLSGILRRQVVKVEGKISG
jgi:hypothetical protein